MRLVKASWDIWDNSDPLKITERAARVCYQSESGTEPEEFVRKRLKQRHGSIFEHAWFAASGTPSYNIPPFMIYREGLLLGNARAWRNNVVRGRIAIPKGMKDAFPLLWKGVNQTEQPGSYLAPVPAGQIITVNVVTDTGVTHEWVRHRRSIAFSQESTRYCCYKNHVTFLIPLWFQPGREGSEPGVIDGEEILKNWKSYQDGTDEDVWLLSMARAERSYQALIERKWPPQRARSVLPKSLKTQIVTTTHADQWRWMFHMRTSAAAHEQMREVMIPIRNEFECRWPGTFNGDYEPNDDRI